MKGVRECSAWTETKTSTPYPSWSATYLALPLEPLHHRNEGGTESFDVARETNCYSGSPL